MKWLRIQWPRWTAGLVLLLLVLCSGRSHSKPSSKASATKLNGMAVVTIDLTHSFDRDTIYWPTAEGFRLMKDFVGVTTKGYFYSAYRFSAAEHGGTHLDAPIHFYRRGNTADQIPLSQLIGPAVVVDVAKAAARNRDYQISIADLQNWEKKHNRRLDDSIVLLRTGFSRHWPDRKKYLGTAELGKDAVKKLHFPGLHPKAARWLGNNRRIKAIGIDTASIDFGQSVRFGSHVALFQKNIPVLENVANLGKLPTLGFDIIALPMKIRGGSGGPTRVVAIRRP